jgi:hypothetical protein
MKQFSVMILMLVLTACGFVPERVTFDDQMVNQLIVAASRIDRASLGFSPIDPNDKLRLEWRPRAGYDAMLHVYGNTSRTIAFHRGPNSYEWIGEQEIFEGPDEYDTADGRFHEAITITFEKVPISGVPLNKIYIQYAGDDQRLLDLNRDGQLTLLEVKPVLLKWGYRA